MSTPAFCHIYGQLDQTGTRIRDELAHLFDLGLVCDASISLEQASRHRELLGELRRRGGLIAPSVYPAAMDVGCQDPNWWKYSQAECVRLLRILQERFAALDLGSLIAVNTYTPGNGFVAACRELGIRYVLGFCAPTVGEDGGWSISHYGSPLSPYFISDEDFRKPVAPGDRRGDVMMVNMELRNPLVCLHHWNEGPWCPLNAQAADRWLEPGDTPLPFLAMAEDWIRQSEQTGVPRFFHLNLQYFFAGRCFEHNRRALEWLAEQRNAGRLENGSVQFWAERLRANAGFVPQTTWWRGEMMGFHVGHRPGCFADVVVAENLAAQHVWQYPEPLPRRSYDYTRPWHYPAFEPTGAAPASERFDAVRVESAVEAVGAAGRAGTVTIRNASARRELPILVWDAAADLRGPFEVTVSKGWSAQVLPHPAGTGVAVLVRGVCPAGTRKVQLRINGQPAPRGGLSRRWGQLLAAETFFHRNRPYTVLASQTPESFSVFVRLTSPPVGGRTIQIESLCGIDHEMRTLPPQGLSLRFDGSRLACWHRLFDVSADELCIEGVDTAEEELRRRTAAVVAEFAPELQVPAPGYQLFGNIRDPGRWDRQLARAAGEKELASMTTWFGQQRPKAGRVVIEVHPGLFLPRGSITKVLGHEFDVVRCARGFGFKELCVDYPQGWDWGVAAWVQWRHLNVRLDGLRGKKGRFVLHLHACDPECRDLTQRVYIFDTGDIPKAGEARRLLCLTPNWDLPRGLAGRWQPEALCSLPLPAECQSWQGVGVWIVPAEKMKLYDWVAERGSPGLLFHLWVTERPNPD